MQLNKLEQKWLRMVTDQKQLVDKPTTGPELAVCADKRYRSVAAVDCDTNSKVCQNNRDKLDLGG